MSREALEAKVSGIQEARGALFQKPLARGYDPVAGVDGGHRYAGSRHAGNVAEHRNLNAPAGGTAQVDPRPFKNLRDGKG